MNENLESFVVEDKAQSQVETEVKESDKEKFIRMFKSINSLSEETKTSILNYLEKSDFFTAPASIRYHNNCPGGLVNHSIRVAELLKDYTVKNNLQWDSEDNPYIIGLLHDICKTFIYDESSKNVITGVDAKGKNIWGKQACYLFNDKKPIYGIHGDKSVAFLLMLRKKMSDFSSQVLACIRFHMGAMQEGELVAYTNAVVQENLIAWVHLADLMASLQEPII